MLDVQQVAEADVVEAPFRHVVGERLVAREAASAFASDFPDTKGPGFFPVEELAGGPAFGALLDDLRGPDFSRIVGEKLGVDLSSRPQMIVARRWSALRDGRPHTDGEDKVATALLYLNPSWDAESGALRYLEGPDLDGPGTAPITPAFGAFTAFARSDCSWHGHKPFAGERRVVQVFWLKDEAALARKTKRHKRTGFLRALFPRKTGAEAAA